MPLAPSLVLRFEVQLAQAQESARRDTTTLAAFGIAHPPGLRPLSAVCVEKATTICTWLQPCNYTSDFLEPITWLVLSLYTADMIR